MTDEIVSESGDSERVYEVGYLVLPSISEEKVSEEVTRLKDGVIKLGGVILRDAFPVMTELAYEMTKEVEGKKERFELAYFGWYVFKATAENLLKHKESLEADPNILRFLLTKTEEIVSVPLKESVEKSEEKKEGAETVLPKDTVASEAIDKSIEELVKEP
jgi:ribosomal protein S6